MREAGRIPLRLENVRFTVEGTPLIDGITAEFAPRGVTVLLGPNGSGKSLLLRLMNGLIAPEMGTIRYGGAALSTAHRKRLALVFQKPVLLRRSVAANLGFVLPKEDREARVTALLQRVGLTEKADQPARLLSGGEAQRLALARALALAPDILFLDEPTASLDPASVLAIERIVTDARDGGMKIVFVTHDLGQARRLADEVVFLDQGRVAEHRPAADFFAAPHSEPARAYLDGRIHISTKADREATE